MKYGKFAMALLASTALVTGGCSTIVEGTDQTVSVLTDPSEASCELTRDGQTVGHVNPTPGSVRLEKSGTDVIVYCKKDGHFDGTETLSSSVAGMTFGNIRFGGVIGFAVDGVSGAMNKYDTSVKVILPPKSFASTEARDAYFNRQKRLIETQATTAIAKVRKECNAEEQDCDGLVSAIEAERDSELRQLTSQKSTATVN